MSSKYVIESDMGSNGREWAPYDTVQIVDGDWRRAKTAALQWLQEARDDHGEFNEQFRLVLYKGVVIDA